MPSNKSTLAAAIILLSDSLAAQALTDATPTSSHPDWIVWAALGVLIFIFGIVAFVYLGGFDRKSYRSYGWWW